MSSAGEIDTAIPAIKGLQVQAVLVVAASLFGAHPKRVVSAVSALRLPALYSNLTIADAGGLVVYTPDLSENFGRAASYVGRILKGAKPGDLPVEQATTFRLIVNRQAARDLGMTLPASVLAGAEIR